MTTNINGMNAYWKCDRDITCVDCNNYDCLHFVHVKEEWSDMDYLRSELYSRTMGVPEMICENCGSYQNLEEILKQHCSCGSNNPAHILKKCDKCNKETFKNNLVEINNENKEEKDYWCEDCFWATEWSGRPF
jgi:hypothetical protein